MRARMGVDYAGEEDCVCQGAEARSPGAARMVSAVGSKTSFTVRFASAFLPHDQTPGARAAADSLAVRLEPTSPRSWGGRAQSGSVDLNHTPCPSSKETSTVSAGSTP